jgi:hypothetical protein
VFITFAFRNPFWFEPNGLRPSDTLLRLISGKSSFFDGEDIVDDEVLTSVATTISMSRARRKIANFAGSGIFIPELKERRNNGTGTSQEELPARQNAQEGSDF